MVLEMVGHFGQDRRGGGPKETARENVGGGGQQRKGGGVSREMTNWVGLGELA